MDGCQDEWMDGWSSSKEYRVNEKTIYFLVQWLYSASDAIVFVHLCVNSWAVWGLFEKLLVQIGVGNKVPRHAFCSFSNQIMEATKDVLFYASLASSVAPHRLSLWKIANICAPSPSLYTPTRHSTGDSGWGVLRCRSTSSLSFAFLSSSADKVQCYYS